MSHKIPFMRDKKLLQIYAHNENSRVSAEKTELQQWEQALESFQRGWNGTTSTRSVEQGTGHLNNLGFC